jgi:hypothetical protein
MQQYLFDCESGNTLHIFDCELDLSGRYNLTSFDDKITDAMENNLILFNKLKEFFTALTNNDYLVIINEKSATADITKAEVLLDLMGNYKFTEERTIRWA